MQAVQTKLNIWNKAYSAFWQILDFIYPPLCIGCGKFGNRCCPPCLKTLDDLKYDHSGSNFNFNSIHNSIFPQDNPGIDKVFAIYPYKGILKKIIIGMKYQRRSGLTEIVVKPLVQKFKNSEIDVDIIIPVPISRKRKRERGYNQVSLWGKPFARSIGIPFSAKILIKIKDTKSQVNLSLDQRKVNLKNSFFIKDSEVKNKNILLLDDVITTGTTMHECGSLLKKAGANKVIGFVIAKSELMNKNHLDQEEVNDKKS